MRRAPKVAMRAAKTPASIKERPGISGGTIGSVLALDGTRIAAKQPIRIHINEFRRMILSVTPWDGGTRKAKEHST